MAKKLLLVRFSTEREVDGELQRVVFKSKSVVNLTKDELELLDKLTVSTGKLHYRDPIREGGDAEESKPEVVAVPDYAGQDVVMEKKTIDQLKAFLTFHEVSFDEAAAKKDLKALADKQADAIKAASAAQGGDTSEDDDTDPDAGL